MGASRHIARAWAAGLCALACAGCISLSWERASVARPTDESWRELEIGSADLTQVLAQLGAPLYVYENEVHGLAVVWGRDVVQDKGINVSVPVSDNSSANFNYSQGEDGLLGVLMLFDADWHLSLVREGYLRDLTAGRDLRPSQPLPRRDAAPQETNE